MCCSSVGKTSGKACVWVEICLLLVLFSDFYSWAWNTNTHTHTARKIRVWFFAATLFETNANKVQTCVKCVQHCVCVCIFVWFPPLRFSVCQMFACKSLQSAQVWLCVHLTWFLSSNDCTVMGYKDDGDDVSSDVNKTGIFHWCAVFSSSAQCNIVEVGLFNNLSTISFII